MIIALIPARAGSKGFKNKNIAQINGETLIGYAVNCAIKSKLIDQVYISTDSAEYEKIGVQAGAKSLGLRKEFLAGDSIKTIDVLLDFIHEFGLNKISHIVLLQPTSPVRTPIDVDRCIELALDTSESVVSVSKVEDPHPFKMKKIENGILLPFIENTNSEMSRQSLPPAYELTGGVYVSNVKNLIDNHSLFSMNTYPYIMDKSVNVDMEIDFLFLKFLVDNNIVSLENA